MPAVEEGLPPREVRDLPDPPSNYWRLVGPGIVAGGVGLSSGNCLWQSPPMRSSLQGALVVSSRIFLNWKYERTTDTGETAVTGFNRFGRTGASCSRVIVYFGLGGRAISEATLGSYC